jgi:hypothetical protein
MYILYILISNTHMSNNIGTPWNDPIHPLYCGNPTDPYCPNILKGETLESQYNLKLFHSTNTFVPYSSPNPICDFMSNIDNSAGCRNNSRLPYSTNGYWKPN